MSKQKQSDMCAICLEDIMIDKEVRIDCCEHIYCKECITQWVETKTNCCPQCKKRVSVITAKDILGRNIELTVEDKNLDSDSESESDYVSLCVVCREEVSLEDLYDGSQEVRAIDCSRCSEFKEDD